MAADAVSDTDLTICQCTCRWWNPQLDQPNLPKQSYFNFSISLEDFIITVSDIAAIATVFYLYSR